MWAAPACESLSQQGNASREGLNLCMRSEKAQGCLELGCDGHALPARLHLRSSCIERVSTYHGAQGRTVLGLVTYWTVELAKRAHLQGGQRAARRGAGPHGRGGAQRAAGGRPGGGARARPAGAGARGGPRGRAARARRRRRGGAAAALPGEALRWCWRMQSHRRHPCLQVVEGGQAIQQPCHATVCRSPGTLSYAVG